MPGKFRPLKPVPIVTMVRRSRFAARRDAFASEIFLIAWWYFRRSTADVVLKPLSFRQHVCMLQLPETPERVSQNLLKIFAGNPKKTYHGICIFHPVNSWQPWCRLHCRDEATTSLHPRRCQLVAIRGNFVLLACHASRCHCNHPTGIALWLCLVDVRLHIDIGSFCLQRMPEKFGM